jgi:hypothetical protein
MLVFNRLCLVDRIWSSVVTGASLAEWGTKNRKCSYFQGLSIAEIHSTELWSKCVPSLKKQPHLYRHQLYLSGKSFCSLTFYWLMMNKREAVLP